MEKMLKILVPVKRVIDYNIKVRIKPDGSGVDLANVKMSINPFDEIAVEEAVRLREAGLASEVIVTSCGTAASGDTLRAAMAMGADRAILINTDADAVLQPLTVAKLFKALTLKEQPHLIILGKQAIDNDASQTGQMLAGLLGWPQATFVSALKFEGQTLTATREIDGGFETLVMNLPALITADLRLNEPRFSTLPNIMKAKKKPLDTITPAELGVDLTPRLKVLNVAEPTPRQGGVILQNVQELVDKLHQARVI